MGGSCSRLSFTRPLDSRRPSLEVVLKCRLRVWISTWNGHDDLDLGALLPPLRRDAGEPWALSADWRSNVGPYSVVSAMSKMRAKAQAAFGSGELWLRESHSNW